MNAIGKDLDDLAASLYAAGSPSRADVARDGAREVRRLASDLSACRDCLLVSGTESERRLTASVASLQEQCGDLRREIERLRRQNDLLCEANVALRGAYSPPKLVVWCDVDRAAMGDAEDEP